MDDVSEVDIFIAYRVLPNRHLALRQEQLDLHPLVDVHVARALMLSVVMVWT